MFAGPNGSGKTTLFRNLRDKDEIHTEIYVSADLLEAVLRERGQINFNAYRVRVEQDEFDRFCSASTLLAKIDRSFLKKITMRGGILKVSATVLSAAEASYAAALIAGYLCEKLFASEQSFCFETVMSHPSKIELFRMADRFGYQSYLYYLFTSDQNINIERVATRVKEGGHDVDREKIIKRIKGSLQNLASAVDSADRTFLIDNTIDFSVIASINRIDGYVVADESYPQWLRDYFDPDSLRTK